MQWLKADLHIHSRFSDGKLSVGEIVDLYGRSGFDVIAITDHVAETNTFFGKMARHLSYSVGAQSFTKYVDEIRREAERAERIYGMRVLFGYEISKNSLTNDRSAHVLILGTEKLICPDLCVEDILGEARAQGALTIAAHPFHTGERLEFQTFQLWSKRRDLAKVVDAWEASYRKKLVPAVLESGLPCIASSDFHNMNHMDSWRTLIGCQTTNPSTAEIFRAVREQKIELFYHQQRTAEAHQSETLPRKRFLSERFRFA